MKTLRKFLIILCAAILLISSLSVISFAEDSNVTYTGNSGGLIFEPGSEYSPTDLFANFKNVMPGASLTQKITVKNRADDKVKVKIYLRSLGSADEKYNEFLNQLTLTVRKDSETPMFDAAADKTAGLTDWVCLGTLYSGGTVDLNVTLDVPKTLDNMFQQQIGKIKWQFVTEEFPIEQPYWECPTNKNHTYHIEEKDGVSTFVCEKCEQTAPMLCETCGGKMHEVIVVTVGGETYTAYPDGDKHYKTEDGRVHFYMNDEKIIDYYTVDGIKTDIKNVSEYVLYTYYECLNNKEHHTDPQPSPVTGEKSNITLWVALMVVSLTALIILLFWRRKKDKDDEEARAQC